MIDGVRICLRCGRELPITSSQSRKYCDECAAERNRELTRERLERARQKASTIRKEKKDAKEKMSPLEQLLFLYLLNHCDASTKAQLAEKLHVTRAAVTKVTEELGRKGLITEKKTGKEVYVSVNRDPKTCYSGAHKWMGNPVKKLVYCADRKACERFLLAGESALSDMSMLAAPRNEVRACYEKDPRLAKLSLMDDAGWEADGDYTCLQVWKYNPELISDGKAVDILSLSLSLANVFDERVQGELQDVLEEEGWL